MRPIPSLAALLLLSAPALAGPEQGGTLNPDEMSLDRSLSDVLEGRTGMVVCSQGYLMTKWGRHADAVEIFRRCAEAGYTGTMTWMSHMAHNGLGRPEDPAEAVEWDRRAAEAGDPIGAFNLGLDLLRGHGVARDPIEGRRWIDRAAKAGLPMAKELQAGGYDPDAVTPDADAWKYEGDGKAF